MHRIEYTIERSLITPGLTAVVLAGIYLASDGHHWSEFFVQWGLGAALVIGAVVGAVMIPTAKRAERLASRDLAAVQHASGSGERPPIELSDEYRALARRLGTVGALLGVLVLATILIMVVKP